MDVDLDLNRLSFNSDGHLQLIMFSKKYIISNLDEWYAARDEIVANPLFPEHSELICSSSIDWPRDETDDEDLIAICNAVRGNSV